MILRLFDQTFDLLAHALDVRTERHRVISANVANQDTPGYRGQQVDFHATLAARAGAGAAAPVRTHPAHLAGPGPAGSGLVATPDAGSNARLDGNSVDAEREMARLAENTLMYNATVQFISGRFARLKSAIREGR